uniref:Xylulose kinase-1 n=1 Tax=Tanacetum cinerariifolium TaxID=118510 RepID=A0A699GJI8_TANCI|nr:hypothetical protein [Tanacetum cinerariifolium]
MVLTFAVTHNMFAYLTKSDASEGFEQILDFLNASVIQYALTVNPTIYVSCIKQFWSSVLIKKTNDVVRLQALIDKRNVIINEDTVQQALQLDDAKRMLVPQQVNDDIDVDADVADDVDDNVVDAAEPTPPPPQQELILSISQVAPTSPPSPHQSHIADKIAQSLKIIKLKQRARRLEKKRKRMHPNRGEIVELDADEDVTLEEVVAEITKDAEDDEAKPTALKEVIEVVTTAKLMTEEVTVAATTITVAPSAARRRKGVVIRDPKETTIPSIIKHSESKSKNKGKVIEQVKRKEKLDNTVMRYQTLKRKPQTEAQARRYMMVYLKNMAGFKVDFFKDMTYDDIRPIFENHFNSIVAFLKKGEEKLEDEVSKAIKRKSETSEEKAAEKQKLDEERRLGDAMANCSSKICIFRAKELLR